MPYKQAVKLSKTDYATHMESLKAIGIQAANESRKLVLAELQPHVEPLTMHWSLIGSCSTTPVMSRLLEEEAGIKLSANALALAMKSWGVPPGNTSGRGAARPRPTGNMALKFSNT